MKKVLGMILALAMVFTLVACGGAASSAPAASTAASVASEASSVAEEATSDVSEATDTSAWDQFADVLTITYMGTTEAGEGVVFCTDENVTFAVLNIIDPETSTSVSAVGEVTEEENGYLTITDETSAYTLTFEVVDNGDGTLTLDMGDVGACTIEACEQSDAFEALAISDEYTTAVA